MPCEIRNALKGENAGNQVAQQLHAALRANAGGAEICEDGKPW